MFTNTHTNVLKMMLALSLASAMLMPASAQVTPTSDTTGAVSTGSPIIDSTFDIINTRTNTDATTTPAKPGDILRVTAVIKNSGTGPLALTPRVISEELFKLGEIVDAGNGGEKQGENAIAFPSINIEPNCNCEEKIEFSIELDSEICTDFPTLVKGNMVVMFQDKVKRIALECAAPVTPTPTPTPTPTRTPTPSTPTPTPKPPKTPDTGPEGLLALSLALAGSGAFAARRVLRRRK